MAFAMRMNASAILVRPGGNALQGRSEILASYSSKDPNRITHHLVCNHRVQISSSGKEAIRTPLNLPGVHLISPNVSS
jgi:hypothetical protein